jgi:Asp/Glu/hydantoin racemase
MYPWATVDPLRLFSEYLRVTGIAHLGPEPYGDPKLLGKRLGLLNGSSWITLWANYFGRQYLPGVHLVNMGNDALQLNFMEAYDRGEQTPPQSNIDAMCRYAIDLVELANVDAILITCSTMNRSYSLVRKAVEPYHIPVVQIDRPMMERAVLHGGRILVVATHGPTVKSTESLLQETAEEFGKPIRSTALHLEAPWHKLADYDVEGHNSLLAEAIREKMQQEAVDCVVLAQLSMTAFLLSFPDPMGEFGIPIFTSGQSGLEYMRNVLMQSEQKEPS